MAAPDYVVGGMIWPLWRAFLDSDHTLETLATAMGLKPEQIENAFADPGATKISFWSDLAFALDVDVKFNMRAREEEAKALAARAGFTDIDDKG